jgi:hypothetical protein
VVGGIDQLSELVHRLGGSIVQRDLFAMTAREAVRRRDLHQPAEGVGP